MARVLQGRLPKFHKGQSDTSAVTLVILNAIASAKAKGHRVLNKYLIAVARKRSSAAGCCIFGYASL